MPINWEEIIDDDVLAHYKRTRTMQKDFAALADRLGALERRLAAVEELHGTLDSQLVVPGETGEWVHRDGCLVYDLDVTQKEG